MVGLKVVAFLAVLSLTSACSGKPKNECTCHKNGPTRLTGLPVPGHKGLHELPIPVHKGLPGLPVPGPKGLAGLPIPGPIEKKHAGFSWVYLGRLLYSIGDIFKDVKSILKDIIHLDGAGALEDVISVVVSLGKALGLMIDVIIPELGGLFGRLVISIVRIIICILGNKGGSPSLLGGFLGSKKSPAACGPDYGCKLGWKRYDGKWDSHQNILRHYGCEDASVQLKLIIDKYLNGRDIDCLGPIHRILYDHISILVKIIVKSYSTWCKDDMLTVYISIVTITGVLGNSCKPGLGLQIVEELEYFCYTHFKNNGYKDIKIYNSEIKKKIERVKCWKWGGVIVSEEAEKSTAYEESESTRKSSRTSEQENRTDESKKRESQKKQLESSSNNSQTRSYTDTVRTDSNQSKETNNESKSTENNSDYSQTSQNTADSGLVDTGKRGRFTWVYLGRLLYSIGDIFTDVKSILKDIIHLDGAGALEDVISVVVSLGKALGVMIDVIIPELGGFFGRLVISIVRIIICILGNKGGSPSLLGGLLGSKKSPAACGPDYGCKWGWKRYDGKWDSHQNILRHYGCEDASVQLKLIIDKYLNGRDIDCLGPVHRILYDHISILVKIIVKSYSTWCKDDILTVYISIVTITGVLGNSCKPGLGLQIVDELEYFCYTHVKNNGYKDIKIYNSEIKKKIERVKCWKWGGVIVSEEAEKSTAYEESESTRKSSRTSEQDNRTDESKKMASQKKQLESSSNNSQTRSNTKTVRTDSNQSKETNNESKSTENNSDYSQTSRDTADSGLVDTGKRGRFTWVYLRRLLYSIGDIFKDVKSILKDIIHLDGAGALEDVITVVVSLGRALGLMIDVIIPGLGGFFGRLVISIVRIIICILGSKGGSTGLLRGRTPAACGPDYGCKWGWKRYDGKWDSHQNILRHYGCEDASVQLKLIIDKYLNGRDIDCLGPVHRILYDHISILVKIIVKSYSTWCKDDMLTVYISITTITSVLGNSCKPGLGLQIVDELESFCYTHFKNSGYKDIKIYNSEIKKTIERVKCWRWGGVIVSEEAEKSSVPETGNYNSSDDSKVTRSSEEKNGSNESRERAQTTTSDSKSDNSETGSDTTASSDKKSGKTSTKSQASDYKSSETNNESKSTDNTSDNSQLVDTGKRGRTITEEVSGSAKENKESSKTERSDTSNLELDQKKIDSKDGTITETKVRQAKASSANEEKTSASSEQQYSSKRTVVESLLK